MNWFGSLRTLCLAIFVIILPGYASFAQHGSGFHGGGGFHSGGRSFGGFHRGGGFTNFHGGGLNGLGGYDYRGSHYHGGHYIRGGYAHGYHGGYPYYGYPPYGYGLTFGFGFGPFWGYWVYPSPYVPYAAPYAYYAPYGYYRNGGSYNGQRDPSYPRDQVDYRRTVPRPPTNNQARCDYRHPGTCGSREEHRPATQQDEILPEDAPRVYLITDPAR